MKTWKMKKLITVLALFAFSSAVLNLSATNPPPSIVDPDKKAYVEEFLKEAVDDGDTDKAKKQAERAAKQAYDDASGSARSRAHGASAGREYKKNKPSSGTGSGGDECECGDGGGSSDDPECINFNLPFGRPLYSSGMSTPSIFLRKSKPSPSIFSPQGLRYSQNLNSYIFKVETEGLDAGVAREVTIVRPNAYGVTYRFLTGEDTGKAVGDQLNFLSVLKMVDTDGNSVTNDPAFYRRCFENGSYITFSASTFWSVSVTGPNGVTTPVDGGSIGIELIKENYNLRQIYSKTDGLADIVTVNDYKYEIRLYNHADIGAKSNGVYTVSGTPRMVWKIENPNQSDSDINECRITQTLASGVSYVFDWKYLDSSKSWQVTSGGGQKITTQTKVWNSAQTQMTETEITKNASDTVLSKTVTLYKKYSFGLRKNSITIDPEGANLATNYTYYENSGQTGKYGRQKSVQNPDGSWETYDYDAQGRMTVKVMSYNDAAFGSDASSAKAVYFSYTSHDAADVPADNDNRPRTVETKILGTTVSKSYYVYKTVSGECIEIVENCADPSKPYGDPSNLRETITKYAATEPAPSSGRVKTIENPDGTLTTFTYELGTYSPSPTPGSSTFTAGTGDALRTTIVSGTTASPEGVANKTTKTVSVNDNKGDNVLNETYAYDGSDYSRIAWTERTFNDDHKVLSTASSNNTESSATWNCCSKDSDTAADGTEYVYSYNLLKQMVTRTKKGANGSPDVVTTYTYDAEGRRLSSTTSSDGLSLGTSATYDGAGRMTSSTDASGLVTTYEYTNGGRTVTATSKGATTITDRYKDGRIKSVNGTAVIPKYYTYGVNTDGTQWTQVNTATATSPRYVKTTTDALGRVIKTESPAFGGGTIVSESFYNDKGQLLKTTQTGLADTLYVYDEVGNVIRSGLDINADGALTLASTDRISDSETVFANESGTWYQTTTNKTYATDSSATATTTGITKQQLTGFASGVVSRNVSIDINGNQTVSTTNIDKASKTVTQTTNVPDSTVDAVSTTVNGLLTSSTTSTNLTYTYGYDAIERRISTTDPRTGASTTAYYTSGTGKTGKPHTQTNANGNTTTFDYSTTTGRRIKVTNALNKDTTYAYNDRGQVEAVSGDATYPIGYVYDDYGQMEELHTYRDDSANPLVGDVTTWAYDPGTGLLTSKTDAKGKAVTYTYDSSNRLATRSWARLVESNPIVTTYAYAAKTGELLSVDYSDSTPDIAYTYNRLGQQATVTDVVGTRTFAYSNFSAINFRDY
jgi:YD repeat-containing protein